VVVSKLLRVRVRVRVRFCFGCVDGDEVGRVAMEVEKEARWPREWVFSETKAASEDKRSEPVVPRGDLRGLVPWTVVVLDLAAEVATEGEAEEEKAGTGWVLASENDGTGLTRVKGVVVVADEVVVVVRRFDLGRRTRCFAGGPSNVGSGMER